MEAKGAAQLRIVETKVSRHFNRMQEIFESRLNLDSRSRLRNFKRQELEIDHLYEQFEKVFEEGVQLQAEMNADFVPDYRPLDKFEEMFYEVKDLLSVIEKDRSPEVGGHSKAAEARPRLPKIDLMEFDGDPMKWPMFFQTFRHLVHDNPPQYAKIDPQIRVLFERSLERNHFPTFELADFVKEQCRILVHSKEGHGKTGMRSGKIPPWRSFAVSEQTGTSNKANTGCIFCQSDAHNIYKCPKFGGLSYMGRKRFVFKRKLCFNCLSSGHSGVKCQSSFGCNHCQARHHTLLHKEGSKDKEGEKESTKESEMSPVSMLSTEEKTERERTVLLSTASVWVNSKNAERVPMRVLLDSGSQCNFITQDFCRRWKLRMEPVATSISGIGTATKRVEGRVTLTFQSRFQPRHYELKAWVIDKITDNLPSVEIDPRIRELLLGKNLADESFTTPGSIDGLIGAELVSTFLGPGTSLGPGQPTLIESPLGTLVMGTAPVWRRGEDHQVFCCTGLNEMLQRFWELEEVKETPTIDPDEVVCEKLFSESVHRDDDGRYTVALPFINNPPDLGDSYSMARRRYLALERRFGQCPDYGKQYRAVIQDYLDQGHMRLATTIGEPRGYYIPHHGVLKESSSSTPLRVVFDASATSSNGRSLNDTMFVGTKLQADIFHILVRFRVWKVAMTADVKQMYRQIGVCEDHRVFQRILWRFNQEEPIQTYELNTVTFGIKSSPFLALRTMKQLSTDEAENFPQAAIRVDRELYMDDVISSVAEVSDALELYHQWVGLFKAGGFKLTKWASNSKDLLELIPLEYRRTESVTFPTDMLSVLGLRWHTEPDDLQFKVEIRELEWSKRSILSTMWDPLGFLTPVTIAVKLLVKRLWNLKLEWDESLPPEVAETWSDFVRELPSLSNFRLPRHVGVLAGDGVRLVGFADASEKAYAAVIYLLVERDGEIKMSRLICSKAKVAPTNVLSIPRLELCGALLLSKLLKKVVGILQDILIVSGVSAFTDSMVVLHWLRGTPHRWKTFVANRVTEIKSNIPGVDWNHVKSEDNPADCASRGLSPGKLLNNFLWLEGPTWLARPLDHWPLSSPIPEVEGVDLEEKPKQCLIATVAEEPLGKLIERSSNWDKLLRITIYILRFLGKLPRGKDIRVSDYAAAERALVRFVQRVHFEDLIERLKAAQPVEKQFRVLTPFWEKDIIRVGGRLRNASWKFEQQHPILLPKGSNFTGILINHLHVKHLHAGPTLIDGILRQKYWVLGARALIRRQLHRCMQCFRCRPTLTHSMMADLTPAGVSEVKPFAHTGVDFAGPFKIILSRHRGVKTTKGYFCIFNCLATRAIHLEAASDLSTECCLAAIKRFLSLRGPCAVFYSDQGTNFVGVKRRLDELQEFLTSEIVNRALQREFTNQRIEWKFNPPAAPHFGGAWEAGVKSVKYHFARVVGEQVLTFEEFSTLLCEIEAVLNSRPLGWLSSDPSDPLALTPAHFLTLSPLQEIPASGLDGSLGPRQRRTLIENMVQSYWTRWRQEYVSTLQKKMKWNTPTCPVKPGVLVVMHQENTPPLRWPLGRIEEVYPGKDGVVRVALVRTNTGSFKRPIVKLAPLPIY